MRLKILDSTSDETKILDSILKLITEVIATSKIYQIAMLSLISTLNLNCSF